MKKEIYESLAEKIRDYIPELVHTPKHSGDTGFFYPIDLENILQVLGICTFGDFTIYVSNIIIDIYINKEEEEFFSWRYNKPLELQDDEVGKILTDILINYGS